MSAGIHPRTSDSTPGGRRRIRPAQFEAWARNEADRRARWEATGRGLSVRMRVIEGVAVLRFEGRLDAWALSACRRALNAVLRIRTPRMVLDLEAATFGAQAIPLLAEILRVAARHGIVVDLVAFPPGLRAALARTAPAQIRLFPAVYVALQSDPTELPQLSGRRPSCRGPRTVLAARNSARASR